MTVVLEELAVGSERGFEHEVLFYRGEQSFLDGVVPFVREGLTLGEAVLVAEPTAQLELLRDALGEDAAAVQFLDMNQIGGNPARIIGVWAGALEEQTAAGRRFRGVGEPSFSGRRANELAECQLHEQLLNVAFDGGPAWRLLCPYDEQHLPRSVCSGALTTHPIRFTPAERRISDTYDAGGHIAGFAAPLPQTREAVLRAGYSAGDVPAARRTVVHWARSCGLPVAQVEVLELATSELVTNSVRHGGGRGSLAMWTDGGAAVVEFTDSGQVTDPLLGRRMPPLDAEGGRGLYLVNQLCDLVQVRSSPAGTTVRVTTWL